MLVKGATNVIIRQGDVFATCGMYPILAGIFQSTPFIQTANIIDGMAFQLEHQYPP